MKESHALKRIKASVVAAGCVLIDDLLAAMPLLVSSILASLYTGRIQHDPDLSTDRLWGEVSSKSAPHDTIGTVSPADLAPVHPELVSVLVGCFCLGDEGDSLSEVEVDVVLRIETLDLDQTDAVVLVAKAALVAEDGSVYVKSGCSG